MARILFFAQSMFNWLRTLLCCLKASNSIAPSKCCSNFNHANQKTTQNGNDLVVISSKHRREKCVISPTSPQDFECADCDCRKFTEDFVNDQAIDEIVGQYNLRDEHSIEKNLKSSLRKSRFEMC